MKNPFNPNNPILPKIIEITKKSKNVIYGVFNGKSKKPLVSADEFCLASYCTWKNISMNDLESLVKNRANKTNWYKTKSEELVTYCEVINNKPLYMLFTIEGKFLYSSKELEHRQEEIRKLLFS